MSLRILILIAALGFGSQFAHAQDGEAAGEAANQDAGVEEDAGEEAAEDGAEPASASVVTTAHTASTEVPAASSEAPEEEAEVPVEELTASTRNIGLFRLCTSQRESALYGPAHGPPTQRKVAPNSRATSAWARHSPTSSRSRVGCRDWRDSSTAPTCTAHAEVHQSSYPMSVPGTIRPDAKSQRSAESDAP